MAYELNQATFESAIQRASDICVLEGTLITHSCTASFTEINSFETVVDGGVTIGSLVTGRMTAGRAGTALITLGGSFESSSVGGGITYDQTLYKNGIATGVSIERYISLASQQGSFCLHGTVELALNDYVSIFVKGVSSTLTYHHLGFSLRWLS